MTTSNAVDRIVTALRERDVQFATYGNEDRVWWTTGNGVAWYAQDRPNASGPFVKLEAVLTPEQAVAATLGGGKLTADQVRGLIAPHLHAKPTFDFGRHGAVWRADFQAIAGELNAATGSEINGDTSDGYHTFNELYHHRAVLFSVVVASHREIAWKSKLHHDGTMYDGMFIVGLDTPWGQASYHYDVDPYWDMFDCEEREHAPEWDGHTPDDAIERIGRLAAMGNERIERLEKLIRDMYLDLLAEMPESLLENRLIQMGELGIEVYGDGVHR